jgi:hypothetical protein
MELINIFEVLTKSGPSSRTNPDAIRRTLNPKDGGDRMSDAVGSLGNAGNANDEFEEMKAKPALQVDSVRKAFVWRNNVIVAEEGLIIQNGKDTLGTYEIRH